MSNVILITAVFGQTAEGHFAARVDDLAWLALPCKHGWRILSGWRLTKPMALWVPDDFYGADGFVGDEAGFHAHVEDIAQHRRELQHLSRPETGCRIWTLWGMSQQSYCYAEGILCHATASHGGFQLAPEQNALVDTLWRNAHGWYEEDEEWAKVAFTFPQLFTTHERKHADRTLRSSYTQVWEQLRGG